MSSQRRIEKLTGFCLIAALMLGACSVLIVADSSRGEKAELAARGIVVPAGLASFVAGDEGLFFKPGVRYRFYPGAWENGIDLDTLKPDAERIVNMGLGQDLRSPKFGDSFVAVKGYLKLDLPGTYKFLLGPEAAELNVMTVHGNEVYRKDSAEQTPTITEVSLQVGYHPFEIVFFKDSNAFKIKYERNGAKDPLSMNARQYWHAVKLEVPMQAELLGALAALKGHITGASELQPEDIKTQKQIVDKHADIFGVNDTIIKAAFDLVATYDKVQGPLFVARPGWDKKKADEAFLNDIHRTIYGVMQHIMDKVYSTRNIERHDDLLDGFKFGSSAYFPGAVEPPSNPEEVYKVKIDARARKLVSFEPLGGPRRPTGAYVAPGSIVTVTVPGALVGKGYKIRVGAHSWDNTKKRRVTRVARVSLLFDIVSRETRVANPLGGGIYIEVPEESDDGIVQLSITNAVRSPYFSATSFQKTTLKSWLEVERKRTAPWADFHSDKFMMQVPTMWITKLPDPVTLMADWDLAMDAMNDLFGQPYIKTRHTLYLQVDLQNRGRAFFPGYPTCNARYKPEKKDEYAGYPNHHLVRGPQHAPSHVFHEQGHAFNCPKYPGERESTVNLPHVAIWNRKFGFTLDKAFGASRGHPDDTVHTLDNTAITWMMNLHFVAGKPMANYEKKYQWKGHAKYVDIARLFGWEVLSEYWKAFNEDVANGTFKGRHSYSNDEITLRKCEAVGVDLRPLLRFWGIHENDAEALAKTIADAKLPASAKIYDALLHYKSLVPEDNKAFRKHALMWWTKEPSAKGYTTERNHAARWKSYDEAEAERVRQVVQDVIDRYFPDGRPE